MPEAGSGKVPEEKQHEGDGTVTELPYSTYILLWSTQTLVLRVIRMSCNPLALALVACPLPWGISLQDLSCVCVSKLISLSRHTDAFCGLSVLGCFSLTCFERCDCHLNFSSQCGQSNRRTELCTVMWRLRSDLHPNFLGHFLHLNWYEKCFRCTCRL